MFPDLIYSQNTLLSSSTAMSKFQKILNCLVLRLLVPWTVIRYTTKKVGESMLLLNGLNRQDLTDAMENPSTSNERSENFH